MHLCILVFKFLLYLFISSSFIFRSQSEGEQKEQKEAPKTNEGEEGEGEENGGPKFEWVRKLCNLREKEKMKFPGVLYIFSSSNLTSRKEINLKSSPSTLLWYSVSGKYLTVH